MTKRDGDLLRQFSRELGLMAVEYAGSKEAESMIQLQNGMKLLPRG
jgi:hypothetical protein